MAMLVFHQLHESPDRLGEVILLKIIQMYKFATIKLIRIMKNVLHDAFEEILYHQVNRSFQIILKLYKKYEFKLFTF